MEGITAPDDVKRASTEAVSEISYAAKLVEHLTGLRLEDLSLVDKMIEDQMRIRAKYQLPPLALRWYEPPEYERKLRDIAKKYNVRIGSKSDRAGFFATHPNAGAVHMGADKFVALNIDKDSKDSFTKGLGVLEHELIHAMQTAQSFGMPIELAEYEAYVGANFVNLQRLKDDPEFASILDTMFSFYIGGSVNHWYRERSEQAGHEVRPTWE